MWIFLWILSFFLGPKMFVYWSHKYAYISETVHLRDEYHYHCIAFDLGYLYLTLSDLRRSNQDQIGKNHSKWLITLVWHFQIKKCLFIAAINMLISQKPFIWGILWPEMNIIIIVLPSIWDIYIWHNQIKVK